MLNYNPKNVIEAVENGVELLDRVKPEWRGEVDKDRLDMGSYANCLLGQILGSFLNYRELGIDETWRYGFDIPGFHTYGDWSFADLDERWIEVLS